MSSRTTGEQIRRILAYVGVGVLAIVTAAIVVLAVQLPEMEYKGTGGGAVKVNK